MLSPEILAMGLVGLAAGGLILGLLMPADGGRNYQKRLRHVKDRRRELRDMHRAPGKDGKIDENTMRVMRNTVEKFNMQEMANNDELKFKLAAAGHRGQKAAVVFIFFRIVLPFILAALTLFYFAFLYAEPFNPVRHSLICLMIMGTGYMLPNIWLTNKTQKRQKDMGRAYPDALDLLVICVESGMSVEAGFQKVAEEIGAQSPSLAEEIGLTTAELAYLGDRTMAYENFANRTGLPSVKSLTSALVQAERYGTPIGQALRVLSDESRVERMSLAERKAASLPAKLTVPMILFFLPVLFVVIIGPVVIQVKDTF